MTETTRCRRVARWVKGLMAIWPHWRDVEMLASFDDHMLAHIGLRRADLHDVFAEPCWCDPATLPNRRRRERILARGPQVMAARSTIAAALLAILCGMDASIDDGLAIEEAEFARIVPNHDTRVGIAAFVEKRHPKFVGR